MREVNLYAYDRQLRPEVIGADFEDGNPSHSYTIRYEKQDAESMMEDIFNWIFEEAE